MSKFFRFCLLMILTAVFAACDSDSKLVYPPEDVVNRVTDFYLFNDSKSFMYLSSNMNRQYDFGELVIMTFDDSGDMVFTDSLLVPSIAGKMTVSKDEKTVYITTRDRHGVVQAEIAGKSGSYRLKYADGTKGDFPEVLKTKKEPYALMLNPDETMLLVTHLLNGELSVIDTKEWKVIKTEKLKSGVTDIVYNEDSGYFLASHKNSGNISLIETTETLDGLVLSTRELPLDLPTKGFDVRSLKQSFDGKTFYAAFQNTFDEDEHDYEEDTAPQLVSFTLENRSLKIAQTLALNGDLGEITLFPYKYAAADASDTGDTDTADTDTADTGDTDSGSVSLKDADDTADTDTDTGTADTDSADTANTDKGGYAGELIFAALPNEEKVLIIDPLRNSVREEISYKDNKKKRECKPYQVYAKSTGDSEGYLFVSCFQNDRVFVYRIDLSSQEIASEIGVLE